MPTKTIFLDRDGVINKEVGYLHTIADFEFIEGVFETCLSLQTLNYQLIILTNQSGIGRGYYTLDDFHTVNRWMLQQFRKKGVAILDVYFCPHAPESKCDCRKPKPGMFYQAKNTHDIDLQNSWMIGDKEADITAAHTAGIHNTVLVKSGHKIDEKNSKALFILDSIKQVSAIIKN